MQLTFSLFFFASLWYLDILHFIDSLNHLKPLQRCRECRRSDMKMEKRTSKWNKIKRLELKLPVAPNSRKKKKIISTRLLASTRCSGAGCGTNSLKGKKRKKKKNQRMAPSVSRWRRFRFSYFETPAASSVERPAQQGEKRPLPLLPLLLQPLPQCTWSWLSSLAAAASVC